MALPIERARFIPEAGSHRFGKGIGRPAETAPGSRCRGDAGRLARGRRGGLVGRCARRAETLKAEAEVQLLRQLADQLSMLKKNGPDTMRLYLRNVKLSLFNKAKRVILEGKP